MVREEREINAIWHAHPSHLFVSCRVFRNRIIATRHTLLALLPCCPFVPREPAAGRSVLSILFARLSARVYANICIPFAFQKLKFFISSALSPTPYLALALSLAFIMRFAREKI